MRLQRSRKAFSLLTAIVIIVLMATVAVLVFNLSGKMVKSTTTQFHKEQAVLLAKSYTEYAVMAITANDRNDTGNCLDTITGNNIIRNVNQNGYRARVIISYIGSNAAVPTGTCSSIFSNVVTTPETPLTAVIDVYIDYRDIDHQAGVNAPWITYHKRTLQKI
jgi:hypothetical protein